MDSTAIADIPFDDTMLLQSQPEAGDDWDNLHSTQAANQYNTRSTRQRAASVSAAIEKSVGRWIAQRDLLKDVPAAAPAAVIPPEVLDMSSSPPTSMSPSSPPSTTTNTLPPEVTILDILTSLREQHTQLSIANVKSHAIDNLQMSDELITNLIEDCLEEGIAREVTINGQISLHVPDQRESVVLRDPIEHVSTNTEPEMKQYIDYAEFQTFKASMLAQIKQLKENKCLSCNSEPPAVAPTPSVLAPTPPVADNQIVNALLSQIQFLQNTVTTLINNQVQQPQRRPVDTQHTPAQATAPPVQLTKSAPSQLQPITSLPPPPPPAQKPPPAEKAPPKPPQNSAMNTNNSRGNQQHIKKQVLICGDSMLNGLNEQWMRRDHYVKVRPHPGATTDDMIHHVRAHNSKRPEAVIILAGHNNINENERIDIRNRKKPRDQHEPKINSYESMQAVIKELKEQLPNDVPLAICELTVRDDKKNAMKEVNSINQQFKLLAQREQIGFIEMGSYTRDHLGQKGLHPNLKGSAQLANILTNYVSKL